METTTPLPEHGRFTEALDAVQAYVRNEPARQSSLREAARRDPEGMTESLVALGAVLLDIAAGAFRLTPDEMLDKVAAQIADRGDLSLS